MASNQRQKILHGRLSVFVDWIATETTREDEIRKQASNIRDAIRAKAAEDDLVVRSTPNAGSFATRTGLRRHMRGLAEVEGQDVDVPFVVAPNTKSDERLEALLPRFEKYARLAYPDTDRDPSKSSVKLKFANNLHYDLVPLLATKDPERQMLVRSDGERRETSIQKHAEFIKARTDKSNLVAGRVKFNEVIRLLKWWRCFRETRDGAALTNVPSFLVNLLAAHAFDVRGVRETYEETIADWFGHLARIVRKRSAIVFTDYQPAPAVATGTAWAVHDPVNGDNNIVSQWSGIMCDELAEWLEEARDAMLEAITAFNDERENDGIENLVQVFGTPIRHHSEKTS